MRNIYIDIRYSFAVSGISGKFNGGNNYARQIIHTIKENLPVNMNMVLVCFENVRREIANLFDIQNENIVGMQKIDALQLNEKDIYYVPQIDDSIKYAIELEKFRKRNPSVKICMTIYDRRHRELGYDKYDGLFKTGIKSSSFLLALGRKLHAIEIDEAIRRIAHCTNQIYTVSNYSMQSLLKIKGVSDVKYYIQTTKCYGICSRLELNLEKESYFLFVSAGRPEKNLIRALKGFEIYVNNSKNKSIKFVATGLNDTQITMLHKRRIIASEILENQVTLKGYVTFPELETLYNNCKALVFTSRNEGFGLPVLEAILRNRPVIASNLSSIPEVAGAVAVYVNPLSEISISNGIEKIMNDRFCHNLEKLVLEKKKILEQQIALDKKIFVQDLLEK